MIPNPVKNVPKAISYKFIEYIIITKPIIVASQEYAYVLFRPWLSAICAIPNSPKKETKNM